MWALVTALERDKQVPLSPYPCLPGTLQQLPQGLSLPAKACLPSLRGLTQPLLSAGYQEDKSPLHLENPRHCCFSLRAPKADPGGRADPSAVCKSV